jgi:hypothetical protein
MQRIIYCAALIPTVAFTENVPTDVPSLPTVQRTDGLWQPVLPPTTSDSADALDRQVYAQFSNDEQRLAKEPGSAKPYVFLPHGALVGYYDDNIFLNETHPQSSMALAVEPGLAFGLGDFRAGENNFLIADYTGRWTEYFSHHAADAYEQFASLKAQLTFAKWRFNTHFKLEDLTGGNADTGNAGWQHSFDTVQTAAYEISDKDSIELQGQNLIQEYQAGADSVEWQGREFYNYHLDPKLTLGAGFAGGVLKAEGSGGQTYEQALLRLLYAPTEKLSFQFQGGPEWRQLDSGENKVTPVLDLTAAYDLRAGTKIELNGYEQNFSSGASGDQDYTATGVSLSAAQEMGTQWLVTLKGGYENNSYFYTDLRAPSPREDTFFYLNPTVAWRLTEHAKIEVFYNYRQNDSDNINRSFVGNQTGVRASFTF